MTEVNALFFSTRDIVRMMIGVACLADDGWCESLICENPSAGSLYEDGGVN